MRVGLTATLDIGDGIGIKGAVEAGETVHSMYLDGRKQTMPMVGPLSIFPLQRMLIKEVLCTGHWINR